MLKYGHIVNDINLNYILKVENSNDLLKNKIYLIFMRAKLLFSFNIKKKNDDHMYKREKNTQLKILNIQLYFSTKDERADRRT